MDNITKTMLSCEDKTQGIADNFTNIGKAFESMKIMDKLEKELIGINDIATHGVKHAVQNKTASPERIICTLKDMVRDGYKGLSPELSKSILNF